MSFDYETRPTRDEIAWELVELLDELSTERINELLAKNVPLETLEFIAAYAEEFAQTNGIEGATSRRLPNLLLLGYLMRLVEERLLEDDSAE